MFYSIDNNHNLYEETYSLIVTTASICIAINSLTDSNKFSPSDYVWLDGQATNKTIAFPLYGPIEGIIQNIKPDCIELSIHEKKDPDYLGEEYYVVTSELKRTFENLF